jgi:hypothetical protein
MARISLESTLILQRTENQEFQKKKLLTFNWRGYIFTLALPFEKCQDLVALRLDGFKTLQNGDCYGDRKEMSPLNSFVALIHRHGVFHSTASHWASSPGRIERSA